MFSAFSDSRKASKFGEEQTVILETPTILLTTLETNPVQSILIAWSYWPQVLVLAWQHTKGIDTVTVVMLDQRPQYLIY